MLSRSDLVRLRDRLQGAAAAALGLLLIVLLFVYLVPRQEKIAAAIGNARREAAVKAAARTERVRAAGEAKAPPLREDTGLPPPPPLPPPVVEESARAPVEPPQAARGEPQMRLLPRPVALDTATLLIQRGRVRLPGVEPVPLSRKCGEGRASWFCGVEARTQFRAWLRARSINCTVRENFGNAAEEVNSTCSLADEDIGRWLVSNGWAEAMTDGPYGDAETQARSAGLGVWADKRPGG